jgi:hypothetical protein
MGGAVAHQPNRFVGSRVNARTNLVVIQTKEPIDSCEEQGASPDHCTRSRSSPEHIGLRELPNRQDGRNDCDDNAGSDDPERQGVDNVRIQKSS